MNNNMNMKDGIEALGIQNTSINLKKFNLLIFVDEIGVDVLKKRASKLKN